MRPKRFLAYLSLALFCLIPLTRLHAAPYSGESFTYRQPDGEVFQVRLFGDEFFAYQETDDGYLVVRDPKTGFFCYANVSPDGSDIISTGVRVGRAKPAGLAPRQRMVRSNAMRKSLGNRNTLGVDAKGRRNPGKKLTTGKAGEILNLPQGVTSSQESPAPGDDAASDSEVPVLPAPPPAPTLNQRVGLVLLASFPDRPGDVTKTVADIDNYCNAEVYTDGGNATSIYGYFKIQSNGKLSYKNNVTAWFTAANPRDYYTDNTISYATRARELIREGLAALAAQGFDFTQCDANNDGRLDGVNMFYAGSRVNAWSEGLWPHQSGTSWTGLSGSGLSTTSFDYQITDMPASLTIGTFCHENGHMICDFPDLYSYDGNAANMGSFTLMASSGTTHPRHVDPYLKIHAGWADVVDITSASHRLCAVQQDRNFFFRYRNPARSQEYFLFEVRGTAGYEGPWGGAGSTNPANGLVVYHALETGSNTYSTIVTADAVTNYSKPYELLVVEAVPTTTATPWYDDPTPGTNDAFTSTGVSSISDSTHPALMFWAADGRTLASGANVHSVSAPGATMSFVIGAGALPATPATTVTATQFAPSSDYGTNAANHTFSVFNSGGGTLSYTVSDNVAWLACSPASGTATTEADVITVTYTTAALAPGNHTATITIDGGAAGINTIPVSLTINPQPTLAASPGGFSETGIAGTTGPTVSFNLSNTGGGTAAYTITKTHPWLSLDRTSGDVAGELDLVTVTLDATSLAAGTYNDTILISSAAATNSPLAIPVSFVVDGADMILSAPNGGESWVRGTTQTIAWVSGIGGNVKIDLMKNGAFSAAISASTPNDGSFDWAIPANQTLASNYRIRITSVESPDASDVSFADFSISPAPIYTANMDVNPGWTLGTGWAYGQPTGAGQDTYGLPDPASGFSGPNVIGYRLDGDYEWSITATRWATTPAFNCGNRQNVTLRFQRWLGVESSTYDHAYIQVSNNGTVWTEVWQNTTTTLEGGAWEEVTYDLSAVADGQSTVFIRWGMGNTDSSWNYCGWNIDDVVINGDYVGGGAGIVLAESGSSTDVTEGGATDTYTIALATQPAANVTITVTPDAQVSVSPISCTFTTSNWATPQTITVTAVNDPAIETSPHAGSILHSAASSDADYNGISLDGILVNVTDNDNNAPVVNAGPDQAVFLSGNSWSPLELTPQLWLDADDNTTITLNGATVSQWDDKSGFDRHATAASTSQPTATAAGLNGKRVLTFDGSTDVMNVDLDFLAGVSHSAFIVAKPTAYSNIYGAANANVGANSLHVGFTSAANYRMNFWANDYAPALTSNFRAGSANVLNFAWTSGVGKQIFANGGSEGTNTNAGVIGTMSGGGRIGRTTNHAFFGGDIAEFIAITGTLSQADRQSMEGYLAHKWGVADWLPVAHPYKAEGPNNAEAISNLDGSATDADNHPLTTLWTVVSGPAPVTFGDASSIDTTATFATEGIYTLRLTAADGFTQISDDVVITVNPAAAGFNVTYSGNGSTGGTVPVDANNPYLDGSTVTVLGNTGALVRAGYTFTNWNTAANGSGTSYAGGATFTISAHTTLYAQWAPISYTVTFDKQSGSGGSNSVMATSGLAMPTATAPTCTGYTFGGYYTQVSGGGDQYYNGSMASARNWDIASNATLYARWTPNTYTVTLDPQGGTGGSASVIATYGSAMPAATVPTRSGYTFGGYYTQVSGAGTQYYTAAMTSAANWDLLANTTLYAQWTANTYDVAFDANGGTVANPTSKQVTFGSAYGVLASTSRTAHAFNGWFTAASGGTQVDAGTVVATAGNHTLYAQWTIDTYTVTYNGNGNTGGTVPPSQEKIHDVDLTLATNSGSLAKTSHTFIGWNTAPDGSGTPYSIGSIYSLNSALTLYAQWIAGTYLTWDANGTTANQTNGAGSWGGANLWWNGISNQNWVAGASATFGGLNTAGGAVTLAAPTTVENFTFNQFTGTYTLGSSGQAITLNSGINMTSSSAAVTFLGPITLGGDQTWTNDSSGSLATGNGTNLITNNGYQLAIDGTGSTNFGIVSNSAATLSGAGALVKNGTGRMNIGGLNSGLTGSVTINGGVVQGYADPGVLGTGNLALNGGVLSFYWGTTYTRALGTGTSQAQILGGESGFAGAGTTGPTINLGTTVVWGASGEGSATGFFNPSKFVLGDPGTTNAGAATFSSGIDLNGSTRTIVAPKGLSAGGNVSTISGAISSAGTAGLIKEGDGTLILSSANTYTGNTTISGGTLRIGNNTAGTLNGGNYAGNISIASGATLQIWSTTAQTLSGMITGAGGLNKAYGGALTLSGPNTYSGRTSFQPQTTAGFTVNITSFNSVNGGIPLLASSSLGAPTTIPNGTIDIGDGGKQASVNLNYTGAGETTDRVINFGFNGTASQTLTASGSGLLKFTSAMTGSAISTQSGKLVLDGTGSGEITQTLPALPTGGLSKNGTGTWTLGGANSYTGPTAITAGKLFLNGNQSSATGNVTVSANATLGGAGTLGGNTTIATGGKLEFNLSTAATSHNPLDLVAGKDFTFSGTSTLTITSSGGAEPGTYTLITGGNNIIGSAPSSLVLPLDWVATVSISGNSLLLDVTSTGGPGPVDHFVISGVPLQTVVGTQSTGITITAQDAANATATSFTGTVTLGGTAGISGTSANFVAGVLSGVSITPLSAGPNVTFTADDGSGHMGSVTFSVQTLFQVWVGGSGLTEGDAVIDGDPDGDGLSNLQEFAFGSNPSAGRPGPVSISENGDITPGIPALISSTPSPVDAPPFEAVFARRKDHALAGITYVVEFSADLVTWTESPDEPVQKSDGGSSSEVEAVGVPFLATVPVAVGDPQPPKFFRVMVSIGE